MQKRDLTSTIISLHCKMDVGTGDVLGILKCLLQNGCSTRTYSLGAGGSFPGMGYPPTSGLAGMWDRAGLNRAGTPTPPTAGGVQAGGPAHPDEERCLWPPQPGKGVCDPHSLGEGMWLHAQICVCMWHMLESVRGSLDSCMLPLHKWVVSWLSVVLLISILNVLFNVCQFIAAR